MKIVTVEEMRGMEAATVSSGYTVDALMESAGLAVAREVRKFLGTIAGSRVLVLVGPGNNGGDGLVAARHLQRSGALVTAYVVLPRSAQDRKLDQAKECGVSIISASEELALGVLDGLLARSFLVIDAVLGTGRIRPLDGAARDTMLCLSAARKANPSMTVVALDVPTGMDADTGEVDPVCHHADITVTFGYPKVGHFQFPGAGKLGRLAVVDIGIPPHMAQDIRLELLTREWVIGKLPPRHLDAHKGTFGHALVTAGSPSYIGAAYLAAQSAARVGSGLVTLACPKGIYPILASKLTEVIHMPLPEDNDGVFHPGAAELIKGELYKYDSLLVGCGMGLGDGLREFLSRLLLMEPPSAPPVVIDADGLNNLSKIDGWWDKLKAPSVLTPHPGEMSTLTGVTTSEIQAKRTEMALEWSARWGNVVVLKGAHSVIASPDGGCRISPFTNPGLASGGTGDVLTGMIAGLMAQGLAPEDAAGCGVYLHGAAGEEVRKGVGDAGIIASDLVAALPRTMKILRA